MLTELNSPTQIHTDALWARIESLLSARLACVENDIRRYPAPIPACDAHFNYLLEQRSAIPGEIARLRTIASSAASSADAERLIEEFVASCPYLDAETLASDDSRDEKRS